VINYYEILGLTSTANVQEIKVAYRKLAKIYHPDKNPDNKQSEEKFKLIKEAYEVLSDPFKKRKHDATLEYHLKLKTNTVTTKKRKNYSGISEEELKRRQYYQQNYSKQNHNYKKQNATEEKKKYNETRAILFSIPIAIALLFFIVNIYNRSYRSNQNKNSISNTQTINTKTELTTKNTSKALFTSGAEPYSEYLEKPLIDKNSFDVIKLKNNTSNDAIVFITDTNNKIIRHYFIEKNVELFFEYLPIGTYKLKLHTGINIGCKLNNGIPVFCKNPQYLAAKNQKIYIETAKVDTFNVTINSRTITSEYTQIDSTIFFNFDKDVIQYLNN
jgi:curved DNA-binding protein CbpA